MRDWLTDLNKIAYEFPFKSPPIPVAHPLIGHMGIIIPGRGFRTKGMSGKTFMAILKDDERFRRNPKWALREMGAITSWDGVLSSRAGGKADDQVFCKTSLTTVAANWSNFYRAGGSPGSGSYTAITGGAAHNNTTAGACTLIDPTGGDKKYLLNLGVNHLNGSNIVCVADLLVAAGNITFASSPLTINTTALTRYTNGDGVMINFDVTTQLAASPPTVTLTYTDNDGNGSQTTAALTLTGSCAVYRVQPVIGGLVIPLAQGDRGVRSVESAAFSATGAAGALAICLFKPLLFIPTIATTSWVERSVPAMLSGIVELVTDSGGHLGCLMFFVNTSTTSTNQQTYWFQTCSG